LYSTPFPSPKDETPLISKQDKVEDRPGEEGIREKSLRDEGNQRFEIESH